MKELRRKNKILMEMATVLDTDPENLPATIKKFQKEIKEIESEIKKLK